jgi:hypothetical protein
MVDATVRSFEALRRLVAEGDADRSRRAGAAPCVAVDGPPLTIDDHDPACLAHRLKEKMR